MTISRTICLGFLAVIITGAFLLAMPFSVTASHDPNWLVALFTSTSAVCVTGLNVVDPGTYFSFVGQVIIAVLIQIGGLGYMTLTTFLMILLGRKFDLQQRLAIQESFDRPFLQGSKNIIISVIATTLIFELTGVFLLLLRFVPDFGWDKGLWFAIFHSVSAFNNAGFGLLPDNLMSYRGSILVNLVIGGLIIFGGIGYQVIIEVFYWLRRKINKSRERFVFSLNFKVATSTTLVLLIGGTVAIFITELVHPATFYDYSLKDKILSAWFQSVSTRTAGFNTIDMTVLTNSTLFIMIALMFIGASPGGTGGGIKTTTFRILWNCMNAVLKGKEQVIIYRREVSYTLIIKAISVLLGSALTVVVATLFISYYDHHLEFVKVFFEVVSAFGTVGLSAGITASLSAFSQLVIIATMYIGRVGIILLIAAIIGDPTPSIIRYPSENLLVG